MSNQPEPEQAPESWEAVASDSEHNDPTVHEWELSGKTVGFYEVEAPEGLVALVFDGAGAQERVRLIAASPDLRSAGGEGLEALSLLNDALESGEPAAVVFDRLMAQHERFVRAATVLSLAASKADGPNAPRRPWFFDGNTGRDDQQRNGWYLGDADGSADGPFSTREEAEAWERDHASTADHAGVECPTCGHENGLRMPQGRPMKPGERSDAYCIECCSAYVVLRDDDGGLIVEPSDEHGEEE